MNTVKCDRRFCEQAQVMSWLAFNPAHDYLEINGRLAWETKLVISGQGKADDRAPAVTAVPPDPVVTVHACWHRPQKLLALSPCQLHSSRAQHLCTRTRSGNSVCDCNQRNMRHDSVLQ